ncbi:MAG TPA: heat shock protein HspQ [Nitrospira sp.]|nr:heat shock protein HspQ [Nitrospira sp.]
MPSPRRTKPGDRVSEIVVSQPHNPYIGRMDRSTFFSPQAGRLVETPRSSRARFGIGDIVRHRIFDFRGVVFDIDPVFANSEEWYESIPAEVRPAREQPFYHLLAENGDSSYVAYVSQQNLLEDGDGGPVDHPNVSELFDRFDKGRYRLRRSMTH